jgi:hypothetical protein
MMALSKSNTHSFVVRFWVEETPLEAGQPLWRGQITHVPGGQRRYLKDLNGILAFIVPYLREMGIKPGIGWRFWHWLKWGGR